MGLLLFMLVRVMHFHLIPWLVTFFSKGERKLGDPTLRKTYLFMTSTFVGFIPIILLASPHRRYMTRFYVIFLFYTLIFTERLMTKKNQRLFAVFFGFLCAMYLLNEAPRTVMTIINPQFHQGYWFSD
jgi:hypothetical protein